MSRRLLVILAMLLAVPVAGFAAMVGQQEYLRASAPVINVALRGADPRDLLRGHYLVGDFAWDWAPDGATTKDAGPGRLCVTSLPADGGRRQVRYLPAGRQPATGDCTVVMRGWYAPGFDRLNAGFVPDGVGGEYRRQLRIYVPQTQAQRLEALMRERPGALSVDLGVLPDETAVIKGLRVDGVPFGR